MGVLSALGFSDPGQISPTDGSHNLNKETIHGASNQNAVNPYSVPDEIWGTIRPFPVWQGQAAMTPEEADAVIAHCDDFTENSRATKKALKKMGSTLKEAGSLNQAKQKYNREEARFERRTVGHKHTTGKYLQGQRVGYAKMGVDFDTAQSNADNAIAALSANL